MDHKIVCWGDYAIPVSIKAKWIAQDQNGEWYWYTRKPKHTDRLWSLLDSNNNLRAGKDGILFPSDSEMDFVCTVNILPPEPGPWTEQLYWIGD